MGAVWEERVEGEKGEVELEAEGKEGEGKVVAG